ncbi:hypothetical protein CANTEDRAFT_116273, partial [Yamadazyma tenuis ATCC 10573]
MTIASPVTHPRIMGVIKECGGKLEFFKGHYEVSRANFYDSFKNFDECGANEKDQSFKYLILLSVITENQFNPFESQETQHYVQQSDFQKLLVMIECFSELDLNTYKDCLKELGDDEFFSDEIFIQSAQIIRELIVDKILLNFFKSYSLITFKFIQDSLRISESQLQDKLLALGCSGKLGSVKVNFI